jgi:hypothetical protein
MNLACSLQVRNGLAHAKKWSKSTQQPKFRWPPDFSEFSSIFRAKISAPRPLIKKPPNRMLVRLASSLKRALLEPCGRGRCGDSSLMGGACQNDVTCLAEKGGGGCVEDRLRSNFASGYERGGGGGADPLTNRSPPAFLLLFSPLLPIFPSISLSLISGWL